MRKLPRKTGIGIAILLFSGALMAGAAIGLTAPGAVRAQGAPTLPPSWTPPPTLTPEPTQILPTFDANFPTDVPIATAKPAPIEQAQIVAPLYFLTKRRSQTIYLARADPGAPDSVPVVQPKANVLSFAIAADGKLAYSTDAGLVAAAGNAKAWKTPIVNRNALRAVDLSWSTDAETLAFGVRATDKDFAASAKAPVAGLYLWSMGSTPALIIPDKASGGGRIEYSPDSWSPDGKYLLVKFAEQPKPEEGFGWLLYDRLAQSSTLLVRYTSGSAASFGSALWLPDSSGLVLFNQRAASATAPAGAAMLSLAGAQQPIAFSGDEVPAFMSTIRFLPDGSILTLGSSSRTDPLRLYKGKLAGTQATVRPIANAFKLAWPGTLLLTVDDFPAYVFDNKYGVVVYADERIFAFDPLTLGISATDGAFVDPGVTPGWQFSAMRVTVPGT